MMKNVLTQIFFFALLLLFNTACDEIDDLDNTIAEGQVLDASTNQPIPFADVELYGMYTKVSFPAYNSFVIGTKADAEGKFSLSFDPEEDCNYVVTGLKNVYLQKYYAVEELQIKPGARNRGLKLWL